MSSSVAIHVFETRSLTEPVHSFKKRKWPISSKESTPISPHSVRAEDSKSGPHANIAGA